MKSGANAHEFYSDRLVSVEIAAAWEASALPLSYTRLSVGNAREIACRAQSVLQRFYLRDSPPVPSPYANVNRWRQ